MVRQDTMKKAKKGSTEKPRPFDKSASPVTNLQPHRSISSDELKRRLKGMGRNWDNELERLLGLPRALNESSNGSTHYFSMDLEFSICDVMMALLHNASIPISTNSYGIALHESGSGAMDFVLSDMSRGVVIRQRVMGSVHTDFDFDWNTVKVAIQGALSRAEREETLKNGLIVISDNGVQRIMSNKPIEKPPMNFDPWMPSK